MALLDWDIKEWVAREVRLIDLHCPHIVIFVKLNQAGIAWECELSSGADRRHGKEVDDILVEEADDSGEDN